MKIMCCKPLASLHPWIACDKKESFCPPTHFCNIPSHEEECLSRFMDKQTKRDKQKVVNNCGTTKSRQFLLHKEAGSKAD